MFTSEPEWGKYGGVGNTPPMNWGKKKRGKGPFLGVLLIVLAAVAAGILLS